MVSKETKRKIKTLYDILQSIRNNETLIQGKSQADLIDKIIIDVNISDIELFDFLKTTNAIISQKKKSAADSQLEVYDALKNDNGFIQNAIETLLIYDTIGEIVEEDQLPNLRDNLEKINKILLKIGKKWNGKFKKLQEIIQKRTKFESEEVDIYLAILQAISHNAKSPEGYEIEIEYLKSDKKFKDQTKDAIEIYNFHYNIYLAEEICNLLLTEGPTFIDGKKRLEKRIEKELKQNLMVIQDILSTIEAVIEPKLKVPKEYVELFERLRSISTFTEFAQRSILYYQTANFYATCDYIKKSITSGWRDSKTNLQKEISTKIVVHFNEIGKYLKIMNKLKNPEIQSKFTRTELRLLDQIQRTPKLPEISQETFKVYTDFTFNPKLMLPAEVRYAKYIKKFELILDAIIGRTSKKKITRKTFRSQIFNNKEINLRTMDSLKYFLHFMYALSGVGSPLSDQQETFNALIENEDLVKKATKAREIYDRILTTEEEVVNRICILLNRHGKLWRGGRHDLYSLISNDPKIKKMGHYNFVDARSFEFYYKDLELIIEGKADESKHKLDNLQVDEYFISLARKAVNYYQDILVRTKKTIRGRKRYQQAKKTIIPDARTIIRREFISKNRRINLDILTMRIKTYYPKEVMVHLEKETSPRLVIYLERAILIEDAVTEIQNILEDDLDLPFEEDEQIEYIYVKLESKLSKTDFKLINGRTGLFKVIIKETIYKLESGEEE